jgi:hypothetical protein
MKSFIYKSLIILILSFTFIALASDSLIFIGDHSHTTSNIQVVYSLDYKQSSLGNLSLRDVFIENITPPNTVSQDTIDYWYSIYLKLV